MAPTKRKSVNKSFLGEVSPNKEARNSNKNKQQVTGKRKLSDKLGPQWSKMELLRFYEAYRRYGKNWKKVAIEVSSRSVEMVEALYHMNQAYLSLPEGTASVVGLIAMMTDHYSVLESEPEIKYEVQLSRKSQKRKLEKVELAATKGGPYIQSSALIEGCLSLLKKAHSDDGQARAVGKRMPRVPVSYISEKDDGENSASLMKRRQKSNIDDNDKVAHVAALPLTEASHRRGSPLVSQNPSKKAEKSISLPKQRMGRLLDLHKFHVTPIYGDYFESGLGSEGVDFDGDLTQVTSSSVDLDGVSNVEVQLKGGKFYEKTVKDNGNNPSDDGGELCRGMEGQEHIAVSGKVGILLSTAESNDSSPCRRKRYKKLFSEDEILALDALQALANLSVMPTESSVRVEEERTTAIDGKFSMPESIVHGEHGDQRKPLITMEELLADNCGVEDYCYRKHKMGRNSGNCATTAIEAEQHPQSVFRSSKGNSKCWVSKFQRSNLEAFEDSRCSIPSESETSNEEKNKSMVKQTFATLEQFEQTSVLDVSVTADQITGSDIQIPATDLVILQAGKRSRRKMEIKRSMIHKEGRSSEKILKEQSDIVSNGRELNLEEKLSHCLSFDMVRRWCTYEWFYSAIDYPWFTNKEFVEYLNHVGLGHIPRLTRVEWGVIRSSLGKPRRFSEHFLCEERQKLEQYRESVRTHYSELRDGAREGLPTDLARLLTVGQRVTAVHPQTRDLLDGTVLTVDHDRCRVQFDCSQFGVEFVQDIDCMPFTPLENTPEALRQQRLQVEGHSRIGSTLNGQLENGPGLHKTLMNNPQVEVIHAAAQVKAANSSDSAHQVAQSHCHPVTQVQPKEAGSRTSFVLACTPDIKASSALPRTRLHHTYPENALPNSLMLTSYSGSIQNCQYNCQESGTAVDNIVRGLRLKAHMMVDATVQAISSMQGEDALLRIGEALDSIDGRQVFAEPGVQTNWSAEQVNGPSEQHYQPTLITSDLNVNGIPSGFETHNDFNVNGVTLPSELITSCVATLLMIQACAERQYPPSDVAQIIDFAVTSLQPSCRQHLPLYRDIQMYMGRIKTQILASIPT